MRLSVEDLYSDDKAKASLAQRVRITLNGFHVRNCVEADEEAGFVVVFISQSDPRFKDELTKQGGLWPTERFEGAVQIIDPEAPCTTQS